MYLSSLNLSMLCLRVCESYLWLLFGYDWVERGVGDFSFPLFALFFF
jgi:hypothetical protein